MDYARKINKPDGPEKFPTRMKSPRAIVSDGFLQKDPPIVEDHRLVNWKVWLSRRRKQYHDTEARTGRHRTEQLINSCESIRPKVEMKDVMEYAATSAPKIAADECGRGVEFWHVPAFLPNRGDPRSPDITATPTRRDLNLPPKLVHVGLPDLIRKEKDLDAAKSKEMTWRQSAYLKKREEQLANAIKRLVPKEPEIDHLAIQGRSYSVRKEWFSRVPPLTGALPEEESYETPTPSRTDSTDQAILQIQGVEFCTNGRSSFKDESDVEPVTWSLHFNGIPNKIVERKIVLRNKGLVPIACTWRKFDLPKPEIPLRSSVTTPFYFNKNKTVILEQEVTEMKVWYLPRSSGISCELWQLSTEPKVSSAPLVFRFWGCSEERKPKSSPMKLGSRSVDVYLNSCMRDSLIRSIIEELMESIETPQPPEPAYRSLFLENDIFSWKNPQYFYHPTYVAELRDYYENTVKESSIPWDLSLDDLRDMILQLKDSDQRAQTLNYFNKQCKELLKPALYNCDNISDKHEAVYNLLCAFFNTFEIESEYTRNVLGNVCNLSKRSSAPRDSLARTAVIDNEQESKINDHSLEDTVTDENIVNAALLDATNPYYTEAFTIRISEFFAETIDRVCAVIDSHRRLNYPEK